MWWLACTVVSLLVHSSVCLNESALEEEFTKMLHDAASDVLAQHSELISSPGYPPVFDMPKTFMRSFQPGSGVGNREELVGQDILELPVYADTRFSRFLLKHFNNSDYIAGVSRNKLVLYKINTTSDTYLVLDPDQAVFSYDTEYSIIDVVLFTRFIKNSESLFVAIATETGKNSVQYVYEITADTEVLVGVISSPAPVKKISYVQSLYRGYLTFLTEAGNIVGLVHKQQGHSYMNHYIEVNYPNAVDLVTFMVHGHGYIAVAYDGYCDVFKMDEFATSHIFFDRLGYFSGIVDVEYFRLGFLHYLAIVDSAGHHLYTWKKGEFSLKQELPVLNAVGLYAAPAESCRDEVLLVTVTRDGGIYFHTFNGQNEKFVTVNAAVPTGILVSPGTMTSFTYHDSVVILFVDFNQENRAIVINTRLKSLRDPFLVEGEKVSEQMKDIQKMIEEQNKEIERIKGILKDAVRKTGTQYITSVQYFTDLIAANETLVERINEFGLEWESSNLTLEEYRKGTDDLEKGVERLEKLVEDMEKVIPDIVRLDEDSVITGKKEFTGQVFADNLVSKSLNLPTVAGMDLYKIQRDVYRLDKPEFINGTLVFNEPLIVNENLYVEKTVNGIDFSEEVMTSDTEQTSDAEMVFLNDLTIDGDLDVSGKVNGIDLSEEVITLNGNHRISGWKNFLSGIDAENVQTKFIDGVDIDDLYDRAFTKSGNQTIYGDTVFSSVTTNDIILNGVLNGFDVKELDRNTVRVDRPATITGFKNFENNVEINGELTVHGSVNGLKIPDDLVLTDRSQNITGSKEFLGHVTVHEMDVLGKVDGLRIPDDIVTLSTDEEISSTLYFADGIVAEKDIIVEGLVDGMKISEIAKKAMKLNETNVFDHAVFNGPVTVTGNLDVRGLVNNVDLRTILNDVVYRDSVPYEINSVKHFQTVIADKVILEHQINGYNISVDFMKINGSQLIEGKKTFKSVVFKSVHVEDDMIGGVNITDLYKRKLQIVVEEDSEIEQEMEFVDNVVVEGNLIVHGTIGGIRIPEDIVLRDSDQPISNKHFAGRVVVNNLIVDGDINADIFGGVNLTQFYNDRISLSGDQTIYEDVWIGSSAVNRMSVSGFVNGLKIEDFAANVMSKTKPQTVTAIKEFAGVFVLGDISTKGGINGFNLADLNKRAFKLLEDNTVEAPLEFEDNITLSDLKVTGDINGVNITRLNEDSLKKSADIQFVQGNVYFQEGFHVDGDIIASNVNGLVLHEDVLLKSVPQTITGRFTFKNVGLGGNLIIKGSINGLDLSEIAPKLARIDNSETVIESNVTFTSAVHVTKDIEVTGTVNEVELKELFDKVLRKTGDQTITGHKVFSGNVTVLGDIDVKFVNGISWEDFLRDVVWINIPQEIKSSKTFLNDASVEGSLHVSGLAHVELINGKNLQKFVEDAVFIDEPAHLTGPIVFKNPVKISGDLNADLINDLRLQTDVITIMCSDDVPQTITGQKTFQKMKVSGDIYADSVNSYDLLKLREDTLMTEGNQTVTGRKAVRREVVFKSNVYPNRVNGMILRKDLVTLNTEQEIQGPLVFRGDVFVDKNLFIKGLLNGVDLYTLQNEAVYLSTDQVIGGSYSLQRASVASNVQVNGTVNGIDLTIFDKNVTEFLKDTYYSVDIMQRIALDNCHLASYLQESLENSYFALDSFETYQKLDYAASFIQVTSTQDINLLYLDNSGTSAISVQNVWNTTTKKFEEMNFLKTLLAKRLSYSVGRVLVTIDIGISSTDSSVAIHSGYLAPIESGFSDASIVFKKTNLAIALLLPSKSICKIYFIKEHPDKLYELDLNTVNVNKDSKSIALFEVLDTLYLAVSSSYSSTGTSSKIYAKIGKNWQEVQNIMSLGSIVEHFFYHGYHYLLFVNDVPVHESKEPKSIQVYRNSGAQSRFVLFQKIPFDDTRGMEIFQFGDSSQLHLIVWNGIEVRIFGLEGEAGMKELFTIPGDCVRDVKPLLIEKDLYIIVGQQNLKTSETVKSVLYKGLTKGVKYDQYPLTYC